MKTSLNLDQFRTALRSGGLRSVRLKASDGNFFITAKPQTGKRIALAATHGNKLRSFRNPAKAIEVLHRMGAHKVEVDTSAWSPDRAKLDGPKRPDTSERQRRAHQAAKHDAWFRQQVEEALGEAADPGVKWDSQGEVKNQSAKWRAAWLSVTPKKARA
ncbi:MAG: hypothetical protein WBE76_26070 [Terracidiphilus sp.]